MVIKGQSINNINMLTFKYVRLFIRCGRSPDGKVLGRLSQEYDEEPNDSTDDF